MKRESGTYPQLHTLSLDWCGAGWQAHLPSLTALLLDVWVRSDSIQHTVNQVASQLTRLRLRCVDSLQLLQPCMPGLAHNLQRLELPKLCLTNEGFDSIRTQLPGLRCVEFASLSLSSSCADVECSLRELRLVGYCTSPLSQLARLPLARAGNQNQGLQRLVLGGIAFWSASVDRDADVAAVCSSSCRLEPVHVEGEQLQHFRLYMGLQDLEGILQLLACFVPDSICSLELHFWGLSQPALAAWGVAMALSGGAAAALARCHALTLSCRDFQDDAACAALLPMLMTTPVLTLSFQDDVSAARLAAMCSPGSLAAVTRPITLRVRCEPDADVQQAQAAIAAAGKAELVSLTVCDGT
jgi:hypothetical protein